MKYELEDYYSQVALLLPIVHRLMSEDVASYTVQNTCCTPQAVILTPIRELAIQIEKNVRLFISESSLKVGILYGGVSCEHQRAETVSIISYEVVQVYLDNRSVIFFRKDAIYWLPLQAVYVSLYGEVL